MINNNQDASNIFARGYYTIGSEIMDKFTDLFRQMFEKCDNCQGFIIKSNN